MALGSRPKPPAESRGDLQAQVKSLMVKMSPENQVEYLIGFFTNIDLVGIRDELRKDATTEQLKKEVGK